MSGPLRAAAAVFVVGFLAFWLIRPIGNPCPDRGVLPQGSTTSSSPSFSPPGTRTCTYATPDGTKATFRYVPWLDWLVLALVAGIVALAVRRAGGAVAQPRVAKPQRAPRPARAARAPRAERPPASPAADPPAGFPPKARRARASKPARAPRGNGERDDAERERAREERARRARGE